MRTQYLILAITFALCFNSTAVEKARVSSSVHVIIEKIKNQKTFIEKRKLLSAAQKESVKIIETKFARIGSDKTKLKGYLFWENFNQSVKHALDLKVTQKTCLDTIVSTILQFYPQIPLDLQSKKDIEKNFLKISENLPNGADLGVKSIGLTCGYNLK